MARLFVGIQVPDDLRRRLAGLQTGLAGARWVAPENLHVTLRFIGQVDGTVARDIDTALSAIRAPAFGLGVNEVGCFGSGRKVRMLWAGAERNEALVHLHGKIESAVVRTGLEPEHRKFSPHITLARFRKASPHQVGGFIEANNPFFVAPFQVTAFTLFESFLRPDGAQYVPLADYPIG
jgi:RNA 2',3'-cyclic 3'-phosphodiesterase